jgi:hypothetical protein
MRVNACPQCMDLFFTGKKYSLGGNLNFMEFSPVSVSLKTFYFLQI